jgi:DnaK suppressor protein
MTKREVNSFRAVLEARVVELDNSTRHRDAIAIEGSADELDRGMCAAERELAVRNLEAVSAKRREACAALRRIQRGSYGICLDCHAPISPARLAALPSAALCIQCQQAVDCCREPLNAPRLAMAA